DVARVARDEVAEGVDDVDLDRSEGRAGLRGERLERLVERDGGGVAGRDVERRGVAGGQGAVGRAQLVAGADLVDREPGEGGDAVDGSVRERAGESAAATRAALDRDGDVARVAGREVA